MKINDILLESFSDAKRIFSQDDDKETVNKYLDTFKQLAKKNVISGAEKDIGKWIKAGWDDFKAFVDSKKEVQTNTQAKKAKKKDGIVVHEDDEKMVVIPLSKDASCYYGRNTKWCTAATKGANYFEDYFFNKNVALFYVLFKNGDKYAASLSGGLGVFEFFDSEDTRIDEERFTKITGVTTNMIKEWASNYRSEITKARKLYDETVIKKAMKSDDFETVLDLIDAPRPDLEDGLAKNADASLMYAKDVLKGPFPKGEDAIATHSEHALDYAMNVLEKPFPKGEAMIASNFRNAFEYAKDVLKGPFPKGEDAIAQGRYVALDYAKHILRGPFPKAEEVLAKDPYLATRYAHEILQAPFPKGEDAIATDIPNAIDYVRMVLKGPFPKAEDNFLQSALYSVQYEKVLKDNGHDQEAREFRKKIVKKRGA